MKQEYNELLKGFINKIALPENLKGTQYIKALLIPTDEPAKSSRDMEGLISLEMPYPTYIKVANKFNVSIRNLNSSIKYALAKLKWDKRMWQDIMDYFGRLIEIDIYDDRFCGNPDDFTWKWDDDSFIDYIADSLYHIHYGIMPKRKKGIVRLYDSKNDKYLDNLTEEDFNNFENWFLIRSKQ